MIDFVKVNAPDFTGNYGWLNTATPITIKQLHGKIVLLDFWTFCCINCMHVIPDLKKLEAKYPNDLVVIGVHSAKFENERDTRNIREAILRYGIEHPVVNDAGFHIWQSYGVNSWPTLILIDPDGKIVGKVSGEGNFDRLDKAIALLIDQFGKAGKLNHKPLHFQLENTKIAPSPLSFPGKITADAGTKRLFIADSGHNRIVVTDFDGTLLSIIGSGHQGFTNGSFATATFHHPQGMVYSDGKLYIADTENHAIRVADFYNHTVSTIAGIGTQSLYRAQGGNADITALNSPWDLVLIKDKLYIAMAGPHQLWVLDLKQKSIEPYAGSGVENIVDGPLGEAALAQPSGITTDGSQLYFVDSEVSAVRSADLDPNGSVNTIVGRGLFDFGDVDGEGATVRLQHPLGIAYDNGKLFVADSYNHKIKIINPKNKTAETFLGSGKAGDVDGTQPQFSEPAGLAIADSKLYVADTNNNVIRLIDLNTKAVSTLTIKKLLPPLTEIQSSTSSSTPQPEHIAQSALTQTIRFEPISVKDNSTADLRFNIVPPRNCSMNSLTYIADQPQDSFVIHEHDRQGTIEPPNSSFVLPIQTNGSGTQTLRLQINVFYCSESHSVCYLKTLLVSLPIKVVNDTSLTKQITHNFDCVVQTN
jgi:thiol-disulfide isomerase/thioredoxin